MTKPALILKNIFQGFMQGDKELRVLCGASIEIMPGEIVALVGPSGSGKSSLLHIAALLEQPKTGEVFINGSDCINLNDRERTLIRLHQLGFVYQFHHLLNEFSARENVMIPQMIAGVSKVMAESFADDIIKSLGLSNRLHHRPGKLSGGEKQRIAIARALSNKPNILIADEPTGNLDPQTAAKVFEKLMLVVKNNNVAALIATHNLELASLMDRICYLKEGRIFSTDI